MGEVISVPFCGVYQARYKTRFIKIDFSAAMYHALLAFIPRHDSSLTDTEIKALLAYLNSSFVQFYIETRGRYIAKGPIGLQVSIAKEMPILDIKKLTEEQITRLAQKFDELEAEAKRIGGALEKGQIEKLKPKIYEIDKLIGEILGLSGEEVEAIQRTVDELIERRVSGSKAPAPESVKGMAKSGRGRRRAGLIKRLDEFL